MEIPNALTIFAIIWTLGFFDHIAFDFGKSQRLVRRFFISFILMSIKTLKIKKLDKTPVKEINPYFKDVKKDKINPIINKIIPINPEREFPKIGILFILSSELGETEIL